MAKVPVIREIWNSMRKLTSSSASYILILLGKRVTDASLSIFK